MKVADLMTRAPETLSPKATLAEAARKIPETRHEGFPVVDEEGRLLGLLQVEELLPRPENVPFSDVEALQLFGEWVDEGTLQEIYRRYQSTPVEAVMLKEIPRVHPRTPWGRPFRSSSPRRSATSPWWTGKTGWWASSPAVTS
jgi:CBS-domain-containing membrane protein